jgi:molybdate transport system substrate-binding protein
MRRWIALLVAPLLVVSACVGASCGCVTPIKIFGAASLSDALEEIQTTYGSTSPVAVDVTVATGSSAALRTQIEQGARADVFLSADASNAKALFDRGLADGEPVPFATNRLMILVPLGNPAGITSPADLGRPGLRVIAAGDEVPVTRYAEETVEKLSALPGYPSDLLTSYTSNIVSREENVGAIVAKIALGEGDAAIVYVTDADPSQTNSIAIPDEANVTATYTGVVLRDASGPINAHRFMDWLRGPAGQQILAAHGFSPPP